MNNFKKVYTAEKLKSNGLVTLVTLPMEESIMVPIAQIIDLMKQGENVLFFSFNHDSIKINEFLVPALKNETKPEEITGGLSVFDSHQIPKGEDCIKFIEEQVLDIKEILEREGKSLSFIFLDLPFEKLGDQKTFDNLRRIKFTQSITSVLVKTLNMPILTASQMQNQEESKKVMDDFMDKDMFKEMFKESNKLMADSDLILGIKREKQTFWKKLINFLLFWRKRNNFTLKVIKNRSGSDGQSYRMNINMDEFRTEIL